MQQHPFGLPVELWVGLCLPLAGFYGVVWPRPTPGEQRSLWTGFVLRWGHALVWVLLARRCSPIALSACSPPKCWGYPELALYVLFMVTIISSRFKPRTHDAVTVRHSEPPERLRTCGSE